MAEVFASIYEEATTGQCDSGECDCFSCDGSCHCECDGGGECDWG